MKRNWLPICQRIIFKPAELIFKCLQLTEMGDSVTHHRACWPFPSTFRWRQYADLVSATRPYSDAIIVADPNSWNELPTELCKSSDSLDSSLQENNWSWSYFFTKLATKIFGTFVGELNKLCSTKKISRKDNTGFMIQPVIGYLFIFSQIIGHRKVSELWCQTAEKLSQNIAIFRG